MGGKKRKKKKMKRKESSFVTDSVIHLNLSLACFADEKKQHTQPFYIDLRPVWKSVFSRCLLQWFVPSTKYVNCFGAW